MLVNSSNIDISKIAHLFADRPNTLDRKVEEYKEGFAKNAPVYKQSRHLVYVVPVDHAQQVLALVCGCLEVSIQDIKSKSRLRHLVEARQIYSYIIMKVTTVEVTLKDAGIVMSKDHASVLHGVKQTIILNETSIPFSKKLSACINEFTKRFSGAEHFIMDFNNIPQF
jgi:hypothetical protein